MRPLSRMSPALVVLALAFAFPLPCRADEKEKPQAKPVTVEEDKTSFTLSNGIVTARVSKRSGDLTSLQYQGMEILTDQSGHAGAYWSHDTTGGKETLTKITLDPKSNSGERGEVSVKGISGGIKMVTDPGPPKTATSPPTLKSATRSVAPTRGFTLTAPSTICRPTPRRR